VDNVKPKCDNGAILEVC